MRKTNLLSVSGGKDSTAMILHAIESGKDFISVFADTGHEHPDTYEYLDYLESKLDIKLHRAKPDFTDRIRKKAVFVKKHWADHGISDEKIQTALDTLKPTGNPFLDLCIWKGRFPSPKGRFCTDELKSLPITEQVVLPILKTGKKVRSWQGIRWAESPRRAKMPMHELSDYGIWIYRPILKWSADEVFAIHRRHDIKPNPLYLQGMNRVGCMPCVMCRKGELAEISRRFPDVIDRLRKWEKIVSEASKRGSSTFFDVRPFAEDKYNVNYIDHGVDAAVRWSKTLRGGKQFDLFSESEEIPACSSNYGLCELEAPED
jgi:3'-phosphoadenosine 5'-phosphosulfate sulfotransferase (PAPS reductase)/FAD synthetase